MYRFCLGWAMMAALFSGCGGNPGPERVVVSGTITHSGTPVSDGQIRFVPTERSAAPMVGAFVVDGKFKADVKGGVPVGTYRVQIDAYHKTPFTLQPGQMEPRNYADGYVREQFLPERFNRNTQLEMTVQPGSGEITKNFNLTD